MNLNKGYWESRYEKMGGKRTVGKSSWDDKTYQEVLDQFNSGVLDAMMGGRRWGRILDFGCGIGRWRPGLERRCGLYCGTDIIEEVLQDGCMLMTDNLIPYPEGYFGLIFSCMVLQHVVDDELMADYVRQFKALLEPGGSVFLVENTSGPDNNYMRKRSAKDYIDIFSEGGLPLKKVGAFKEHSVLVSTEF